MLDQCDRCERAFETRDLTPVTPNATHAEWGMIHRPGLPVPESPVRQLLCRECCAELGIAARAAAPSSE